MITYARFRILEKHSEVSRFTASFARSSTCSLPGMPIWPGTQQKNTKLPKDDRDRGFSKLALQKESEKIMNYFFIDPSMSSSAKRSARSSVEYIEDLSGNLIDFLVPLEIEKSAEAPTIPPV